VPADVDQLFPVPTREPGRVGAVLSRVSSGVAAVSAQVEPYAEWWDRANRDAVARLATGSGRLWVVMGDSTAQGIGASAPDRGWVGQLAEMDRQNGDPDDLALVNLSVSGARVADLLRDQLPRYQHLLEAFGTAARTTVAIGANDAFRSPNVVALRRRLARVCEELPRAAAVAALPEGASMVARMTNRGLRASARRHDLVVADINQRVVNASVLERLASDRFHPNDVGYTDWAAAFAAALGVASSTTPR
jgi:lysophospholipase L1-like esterase